MRRLLCAFLTPFFIVPTIACGEGSPKATLPTPYKVFVICDLPTAIEAGNYEITYGGPWEITSTDYPESSCRVGKAEVFLIPWGVNKTSGEVFAKFDKLRPGNLSALLALGAAYPELQRHFWIAAFGSALTGRGVPVLDVGGNNKRRLHVAVAGPGEKWLTDSQPYLLAVRKDSK